jgi:glutamate synthase domain-containing protein 1
MTSRRGALERVAQLEAARSRLLDPNRPIPTRKGEAEGGCGVIGIAASVPVRGRHLLTALTQMRNRGNGKGGGVAMAGLDAGAFGVTPADLQSHFAYTVAYLDASARAEVERAIIEPSLDVHHVHVFPRQAVPGLEVEPPLAVVYFARPRPSRVESFVAENRLTSLGPSEAQDEFIFQLTYRLNRAYYASLGEKRAFVFSHAKDLLVLKLVGYGDDVVHAYGLADQQAHVWIGHHRYPTKGRVWHPGGAHPFIGMHEALVHNGDFANYASVCAYLAQHGIEPLFLTDTEVSVLVFDLLHRTFRYPLEYVIEALAPTTERDFALLSPERQRVYRRLQAAHIHASPDGPWFFLIAQSEDGHPLREPRLIGITDTSMLRPQVFALQHGRPEGVAIGLAASERQAIDAALESLSQEDGRFGRFPDLVWNARGGSHTDGGAFIFRVERSPDGAGRLICTDKFGRVVEPPAVNVVGASPSPSRRVPDHPSSATADETLRWFAGNLPSWDEATTLKELRRLAHPGEDDASRWRALQALTLLLDRRIEARSFRRRIFLEMVDGALGELWQSLRERPTAGFHVHQFGDGIGEPGSKDAALVIDGRGFPSEGSGSLAEAIRRGAAGGYRRIIVAHARGHRFLACGLGPDTAGLRIDVYGSPGDYLGSGLDGAELHLHAGGQDQLAQIMKSGLLVVHGDVGQTFMYAAKGGSVFVLGDAAGRPLINGVGRPKVVINGTCLDYLAESFMAGDSHNGGGFAILNGVRFDEARGWVDLPEPYPGGNLFSLASGGALFLRDPRRVIGEDQLNGGEFRDFNTADWELIRPVLEENERHFGIAVRFLLSVDGETLDPRQVYRVIQPSGHSALQPEEAWVTSNRHLGT